MLNPELAKLSDFDFFEALTNERFYRIEVIVQDKNAADGSAFEPQKQKAREGRRRNPGRVVRL